MSQSDKPIPIPFLGLDLAGNPKSRPFGSATVCDNLRVMPGGWLRLRGGRKARISTVHEDVVQIMPGRTNSESGGGKHLYQSYSGGVNQIYEIDLSNWTASIVEECGSNVTAQQPVPYCIANESVIYGNGHGDQNRIFNGASLRSVPSLSYWRSGQGPRFLGLYPYWASTSLSYNTSNLVGGKNLIPNPNPITVYCGLYNTVTGHLSNVLGGTLVVMPVGHTTIELSGFSTLSAPWHSTAERDEIKIVFYSTVIAGSVPYLILNAAGDAPLTANLGDSSVSLNLTGATSYGFFLDYSREAPRANYPPRQMRSICYASGRLFGVLRPEATSETRDASWPIQSLPSSANQGQWIPEPFEYQVRTEELAGVVWSAATGDRATQFTGGDPLQIWNPVNFSPTPNGERPLAVFTAPNDSDVVVWTGTRTYILREQADQLMEWNAVAEFGLSQTNIRTLKRTRYGVMWVNNFNQICLMDSSLRCQVISGKYDSILRAKTVQCAGYFFDPLNEIDRYQVFYVDGSTGKSVCHDFRTGTAYTTSGTSQNEKVRSTSQVEDASGRSYMLTAAVAVRTGGSGGFGTDIFSIESQPDQTYQIPTKAEEYAADGVAKVEVELPDGTLETNWTDGGDMTLRKEIMALDVLGDTSFSETWQQNVITGETFKDYEQVTAGSGRAFEAKPITQQESIRKYLGRMWVHLNHMFAAKFRITLKPHAADFGSYYKSPADDGQQAHNFYGSIMQMELKPGKSDNRG